MNVLKCFNFISKNKLYEVKNLSKVSSRTLICNESDSVGGIDDMICLSDLTEGSLLWNLKTRYERNQIYVSKFKKKMNKYYFHY